MRGAIGVACGVAALGLAGAGSGTGGGDAAVYAAQAAAGEVWSERSTHAGWIGFAALLGRLSSTAPQDLWRALNVVHALLTGLSVLAVARWSRAENPSGSPPLAALCWGLAVLPLASWAEVDVPWVLAVLVSAGASSRLGSGAAMAAAVALSPVALLALPWRVAADRRPEALQRTTAAAVAAVAAVLVLTVLSDGGWWTGERGVLRAEGLHFGRAVRAWWENAVPLGVLPLAVLGATRTDARTAALCLPLLLAPADVPGWLLLAATAAHAAGRTPKALSGWRQRLWIPLLSLQAVGSVWAWETRRAHSRHERAVVASVADALAPGDGLVAPWTWGVRVSLAATGDPYGLRWRPPRGWVRDQAQQWCAPAPPRRDVVLPPGRPWTPLARVNWTVDAHGVHWADTQAASPRALGCAPAAAIQSSAEDP